MTPEETEERECEVFLALITEQEEQPRRTMPYED